MGIEELRGIVKKVSCPSYKITARSSLYGSLMMIDVERTVKDRETEESFPLLVRNASFPQEVGEADVLDIIRRLIHRIAIHEIDERFSYDGKRIFDPHRDL